MSMSHAKVDWDAVHRSNYERTAFGASDWILRAWDLYESARRLEPEVLRVWERYRELSEGSAGNYPRNYCQGVYFMLLSFAVENLLKAAVIAKKGGQYRQDFRAKRRFPAELKGHDLLKLAHTAGLNLQDGEEDLLRRLKRCAIWCGRYPVPLSYAEMSGEESFMDGKRRSISWYGRGDIDRLNTFMIGLPARLDLAAGYWPTAT
jgi:hypothetical protein